MIVNPECHVNKIPEYAEILCNYEGLTDASVEFSYSKEGYTPFAGWSPDNLSLIHILINRDGKKETEGE